MSGHLYAYHHDGRAPYGYADAHAADRLPGRGQVVAARVCAVLSLGYLAPWAVAAGRGRPDTARIAALNLFTGWTLIGWVAALDLATRDEV
jgi:prepilin-type processing-associated H-X9-DG protein